MFPAGIRGVFIASSVEGVEYTHTHVIDTYICVISRGLCCPGWTRRSDVSLSVGPEFAGTRASHLCDSNMTFGGTF